MKKDQVKKVLLVIFLVLIAFIGWLAWELYTDEPPRFFPLNNSDGEYRITRNCPGSQGWLEQIHSPGTAYCVEYKGADVFMNEEHGNPNFFRITVGKSNLNLAPFNKKRVKNIEGKYTTSSKQCIQDTCVNINGPFVVLDIDKLERF